MRFWAKRWTGWGRTQLSRIGRGLLGWRRILQDLKSWNYRIVDARYREHLHRVLAIFDARVARQIDFATRLEAADALGQAG